MESPCVHVVDDDGAVLSALTRLLRSEGLQVRTFNSSRDFLAQHGPGRRGCVVLDLAMPEASGLEVQQALRSCECGLPVVFLSAHGDVVTSVRAMKAGAVDFLTKPVESVALIDAVRRALERDAIQGRIAGLTRREREVMAQLLQGKLNKQIAAGLGASEKTIKVHRARVLHKMQARSIAALVRLCGQARPE